MRQQSDDERTFDKMTRFEGGRDCGVSSHHTVLVSQMRLRCPITSHCACPPRWNTFNSMCTASHRSSRNAMAQKPPDMNARPGASVDQWLRLKCLITLVGLTDHLLNMPLYLCRKRRNRKKKKKKKNILSFIIRLAVRSKRSNDLGSTRHVGTPSWLSAEWQCSHTKSFF
jgi:hypothetical protein